MNKHWSATAVLAIALASVGCVVQPAPPPPVAAAPPPEVIVDSVPQAPPVQTEVVVPQPSPAHVWVGGYWAWRPARRAYVWVPGRWVVPASPRHVWVPGHWQRHPRGYVWVEGHWRF